MSSTTLAVMYEVGTSRSVRAFHTMPGMPPPEGERHAHDYRLEAVVHRAELDEQGMVCDLDVLDAALAKTAARLEEQDLDAIIATNGEPVTVEAFARWLHAALSDPVKHGGGEDLSVRVWESPVAFGGYAGPVGMRVGVTRRVRRVRSPRHLMRIARRTPLGTVGRTRPT